LYHIENISTSGSNSNLLVLMTQNTKPCYFLVVLH